MRKKEEHKTPVSTLGVLILVAVAFFVGRYANSIPKEPPAPPMPSANPSHYLLSEQQKIDTLQELEASSSGVSQLSTQQKKDRLMALEKSSHIKK